MENMLTAEIWSPSSPLRERGQRSVQRSPLTAESFSLMLEVVVVVQYFVLWNRLSSVFIAVDCKNLLLTQQGAAVTSKYWQGSIELRWREEESVCVSDIIHIWIFYQKWDNTVMWTASHQQDDLSLDLMHGVALEDNRIMWLLLNTKSSQKCLCYGDEMKNYKKSLGKRTLTLLL